MGLRVLCFGTLFLFVVYPGAAVETSKNQSQCQPQYCGNQTVPYPFGLKNNSDDGCLFNSSYLLTCNDTFNPPKLFHSNIPILNISVENVTAIAYIVTTYCCYNESGRRDWVYYTYNLSYTPFTISSTRNTFTAIGCDTQAYLFFDQEERAAGCFSTCDNNTLIKDLSHITQEVKPCSDIGCCQTTKIPKGLKYLQLNLTSFKNHSNSLVSNPCDYAFLTAGPNAKLINGPEDTVGSEVMLDWAVGDTICEELKSICGRNTNCINSNSSGYRCSCMQGYAGNPFTVQGCEDINECLPENRNEYPCKGKCKNTPGNYTCQCSFGYGGDGKLSCRLKNAYKIVLGIGGSLLPAILIAYLCKRTHKKIIQEKNDRKNGGLLLKHLSVKHFKETVLQKATNNFDADRLLGEGGNGWVYKGSVEDMIDIAIKKSKELDQNQIEQFLNEADVVSKINHKNVVKLMGVCLESKVPMLIYEYVPNGTLSQHIHAASSGIISSWHICLKIVAEIARALDYMHSQADPPIIHRDVKPSNILLDGTYTAKVSDFGASKLIRLDHSMATTKGQGTMGYFDPEYFETGELTTKSDVYGFGVVLMELLTKRKPLSQGRYGEMISIVQIFASALEENQLDQVLKVAVANERESEQVRLVAKLAVKCVARSSDDRPTMTEVADVLNGLQKEYSTFQVEGSRDSDELVSLLDDQVFVEKKVQFELGQSSSY